MSQNQWITQNTNILLHWNWVIWFHVPKKKKSRVPSSSRIVSLTHCNGSLDGSPTVLSLLNSAYLLWEPSTCFWKISSSQAFKYQLYPKILLQIYFIQFCGWYVCRQFAQNSKSTSGVSKKILNIVHFKILMCTWKVSHSLVFYFIFIFCRRICHSQTEYCKFCDSFPLFSAWIFFLLGAIQLFLN